MTVIKGMSFRKHLLSFDKSQCKCIRVRCVSFFSKIRKSRKERNTFLNIMVQEKVQRLKPVHCYVNRADQSNSVLNIISQSNLVLLYI